MAKWVYSGAQKDMPGPAMEWTRAHSQDGMCRVITGMVLGLYPARSEVPSRVLSSQAHG